MNREIGRMLALTGLLFGSCTMTPGPRLSAPEYIKGDGYSISRYRHNEFSVFMENPRGGREILRRLWCHCKVTSSITTPWGARGLSLGVLSIVSVENGDCIEKLR